MSGKPRVIVVGGGPVGLFTAHALAKANIDYVLLEQQSNIHFHKGAGLVVFPNTARLLSQLGLYEQIEELSTELDDHVCTLHNGSPIVRYRLFRPVQECWGYPCSGLSRREMLQVLYENLPERETRVRTKARIVNIDTHATGVRVHLEDGSVEEGSLVIGADGVHSRTREAMNRLIRESTDGVDEGKAYPMVAYYKALFGRAPVPESVRHELGTFVETHGTGFTSQAVVGKEFIYYNIIKLLPKPTTGRRRFTTQELEEEAKSYSDLNLFLGVKYKDIWAASDPSDATLVYMEEGFTENWHSDRVVLLGDAVHKMTPMNGMGLNLGFQDAAVLLNQLHSLPSSASGWSADALKKALDNYQRTQWKACRQMTTLGAMMTRMGMWTTWFEWFFDRFITPWMDLSAVGLKEFSPVMTNSHVLEYLPWQGKSGTVPWVHLPKVEA